MKFNSIDFAVFLPIVFFLYWAMRNRRLGWQNLLIVIASYVFYGWWDWRFVSLLIVSTLSDYGIGLALAGSSDERRRKMLLISSLAINLGLLGFFKYFNFFIDSVSGAFTLFGREITTYSLNVILPVGISFYTFQTLSYTIDVYRRKIEPTRDFVAFAAYVSFFPQLVAGPIERAAHLLPQFHQQRQFDYGLAKDGMRQILWGLFKKVVIADNCAVYANMIFDNSADYSGSTLWLGAFFFAFQIYGDFSGYSDIAIGVARLFGFDLMRNFAYPYFARDIAEFWRRWHISLTTWFRDYVYIPLGGSRVDISRQIRNVFIVFLVSGLWHGANWTFICWGAINALYFLPLMLLKKNRNHLDVTAQGKWLPGWRELMGIGVTFILTLIAWVFFRAENVPHAISYLGGMFSPSAVTMPEELPKKVLLLVACFLMVEWLGRDQQFAIQKLGLRWPRAVRWSLYYALILMVFLLGGQEQEFIYFQF
ncbi:MBOAT family O-acyltransferase [Cerasicoccus frondis]|uniref:MBOAT family O-acyltransferase n=1 Tax=Cerasicoccus frondis TaxID=490090 RepID=UPI00285295E0|nr:MBOAT family protein [Cerasicoccus frondis]